MPPRGPSILVPLVPLNPQVSPPLLPRLCPTCVYSPGNRKYVLQPELTCLEPPSPKFWRRQRPLSQGGRVPCQAVAWPQRGPAVPRWEQRSTCTNEIKTDRVVSTAPLRATASQAMKTPSNSTAFLGFFFLAEDNQPMSKYNV